MLPNIIFIVADPLAESLRQEISQHVRFINTVDKASLEEIKKCADVIISRAYAAEFLRKNLDIPVVNLEISSYDILRAIFIHRRQIMQQDEKEIGLIVHYKTNYDIKMMEQIIGLKIHLYSYRGLHEIREAVDAAYQKGIRTFFGGPVTVPIAKGLGISAYTIRPNRETIFQAINKAKDILKARQQDQEIHELLKAIVNLNADGIIAIGSNGQIIFVNPNAKQILDLNDNAVGLEADAVLPKNLLSLLQSHVPVESSLIKIKQDTFVVNSTPILISAKQVGGLATINAVSTVQVLEQKIRSELFSKGLVTKYRFDDIVGQSPSVLQAISEARRFAQSDATVLISGESGTGKELFAQSIHQASQRSQGPFVPINCAALPEHLLESELFGYEEGAFTGARKGGKIGLFEMAHKGTLFLDEISESTPHIQSSLLRVLQNKQVMRVGGLQVIPVDVRIIAAVNKDIEDLVSQGIFRQDLFFRLNILNLNIPPLRDRLYDIPYLVQNFLTQMSSRYNKQVLPLSDQVILALQSHKWLGNIRELENFIEKYVVMSDPSLNPQKLEKLALSLLYNKTPKAFQPLEPTITIPISSLEEMESSIVLQLDQMTHDKDKLAKRLGISRSTLWRKLRNLNQ